MTVVPFRRVRPTNRLQRPVEPPPALSGGVAGPSHPLDDPAEDRRRMLENLGAIVVVVLLLVIGTWLIDRLQTYSRTMACLDFGHRNCLKLDVGQSSPR